MSAAPTVISVPRPRASVLRPDFLVGVALAVVTLALYWPVTHFEFISFDDGLYITDNATVQEGLTLDGVKWAFGALHASNWHPVTWLSHMLDCTLHRLNAGGHHFTNVLLHAANTVFLFGLLLGWTGARWRSAVVAGLFAWHPLHVESVAWVAERKDVLSTLFLLATLHAYGRYTVRRAWGWYALALVWFALGLMSKAMLVTLPCLLLLLDYWPLRRWRFGAARDGEEPPGPPVRLRTILLEKIPFFLLTLGVCVVTVVAQKSSGALKPLASMPVTDRLSNTVTAYAGYLWKTIWPEDLAIFYPLPGSWAAGTLAVSCAVMAGVTALADRKSVV